MTVTRESLRKTEYDPLIDDPNEEKVIFSALSLYGGTLYHLWAKVMPTSYPMRIRLDKPIEVKAGVRVYILMPKGWTVAATIAVDGGLYGVGFQQEDA